MQYLENEVGSNPVRVIFFFIFFFFLLGQIGASSGTICSESLSDVIARRFGREFGNCFN